MPDFSAVYTDVRAHLSTDLATKATALGLETPRNIVAAQQLIRPPAAALTWEEIPFEYPWRSRADGAHISVIFRVYYMMVFNDEIVAEEGSLDMAQALLQSLEDCTVTGIPNNEVRPLGPINQFTGNLEGEEDLRCRTVTMRLEVIY